MADQIGDCAFWEFTACFKGPATVALSLPIAVLAIPFFDTFAAIARRKLTGRSIYIADREHLHHCLQRRGFLQSQSSFLSPRVSCFALTAGRVRWSP